MKKTELKKYEKQLRAYLDDRRSTAEHLAAQVKSPIGANDLSNVPMHLGDLGTEEFNKEMNVTLLEHEDEMQAEVVAALERIENGTFGKCENCGRAIAKGRLEAVPYTRYCVRCAETMESEHAVNLNDGRSESMPAGRPQRSNTPPTKSTDKSGLHVEGLPNADMEAEERSAADVHAAGTPGGGAAVGGLAGTTVGDGAPSGTGLEDAMGSSEIDITTLPDDDPQIYSGRAGGAVGGTPANKRAVGGRGNSKRTES